jgi:hypothetical protein
MFELLAKNARSIIAFQVVTLSFGFLFLLLIRNKEIPTNNATILNVAAGLVLGVLATVCAYYFGSSKDKSDTDKADIQTKILEAEKKTGILASMYSKDSAYMIGSLITKDSNTYRCIMAVAAGEDFDISKWELVK